VRLVTFTTRVRRARQDRRPPRAVIVDPLATLCCAYGGDAAAARAAADAPRDMVALLGSGAVESGVMMRVVDIALDMVAR
jgi:hypothetical protein